MEGIKIYKKPVLKNPVLICAWPGMGEVAFKAATYLAETLKAEECAEISPGEFFYLTGSMIQDGIVHIPQLPYSKFFYWKNPTSKKSVSEHVASKHEGRDIVFFVSSAQPDLVHAEAYCKRILSVAKLLKVKTVITFAAMPQPVEHTQNPHVWFAATSPVLKSLLQKHDLTPLIDGQVSGMNGLFLGLAKKEGLDGFCLLGEIPLYTVQIENPKASYAALDVLSRILNVHVDFSRLIDQAHAMDEEINKLLDYLKIGTPAGPIGEEEIDKIKKTLSQLTRLPSSVKDKIDRLFTQAQKDLSKAPELKGELDRWNVYKDYEDKFLDLFKKSKETSN